MCGFGTTSPVFTASPLPVPKNSRNKAAEIKRIELSVDPDQV
jgi:hypothetical protein